MFKRNSDTAFSHTPSMSINSRDGFLAISIDTDMEDLNRQPKNIKIPNATLNNLTLFISGFDDYEPVTTEKNKMTVSGKIELVNVLANGETESFELAQPKIIVKPVKKGKYPSIDEIKNIIKAEWQDAYSSGLFNLNNPIDLYEDETWFERFKSSSVGKFLLVVGIVFFLVFIGLAAFGWISGKSNQQELDPNQVLAEKLVNDPEAVKNILMQLESQDGQAAPVAPEQTAPSAAEVERKQELSSFGLDPGVSDE